jgi:branched-subunit amino acid aminotransferase/4-amino-4-deoxychorismate lyase
MQSPTPGTSWLDGGLAGEAEQAQLERLLALPGCYTTARVEAGRIRLAGRHCARLQRDAISLRLAPPADAAIRGALLGLAEAVFGDAAGIVRLQLSADEGGATHLIGTARALGADPDTWRAIRTPEPHPGPSLHPGAKCRPEPMLDRARKATRNAGVDEALLFDPHGRLVEGARSNLVVVTADGELVQPDPALGAVAGIALAGVTQEIGEIRVARCDAQLIADAREVVALNAVRGARAIVKIDGLPRRESAPGPWAKRLDALLRSAAD